MAKKETKLNVGKGGYTYTDEDKGITKEPGGYQYTQAEWDEIRDRSASTKPTTLKNEKYKPVKVTKKEVSVETPSGDIGTVQKTEDVVGPDMSKVVKEEPRSQWMDPHDQARRMLGFKKGGKVKSKCMSSGGKVSSASKRADGIATKGKTKGRII